MRSLEAAYICFEEGFAFEELGKISMVSNAVGPVMAQHDVHRLLQLLQAVGLQFSDMVCAPHCACRVGRPLKMPLR